MTYISLNELHLACQRHTLGVRRHAVLCITEFTHTPPPPFTVGTVSFSLGKTNTVRSDKRTEHMHVFSDIIWASYASHQGYSPGYFDNSTRTLSLSRDACPPGRNVCSSLLRKCVSATLKYTLTPKPHPPIFVRTPRYPDPTTVVWASRTFIYEKKTTTCNSFWTGVGWVLPGN